MQQEIVHLLAWMIDLTAILLMIIRDT